MRLYLLLLLASSFLAASLGDVAEESCLATEEESCDIRNQMILDKDEEDEDEEEADEEDEDDEEEDEEEEDDDDEEEEEDDDDEEEDEEEDECQDDYENCEFWAGSGECDANSIFMHVHCKFSCSICEEACKDYEEDCRMWASEGDCKDNPDCECLFFVHWNWTCCVAASLILVGFSCIILLRRYAYDLSFELLSMFE
jgi:hypothetical protein